MTLTSSPLQRNSRELSRRMFLRGTGVVMALPWLESMPVWGAQPTAAATAPRRLAFLFMGNGVNPTQWLAKGSGAEMELGPSLAPLEPLKGTVQLHQRPVQQGRHRRRHSSGMTGNLLSGAPLTKGAELHGGVSLDQVLASRIGDQTVQPSMVLGCEQPVTGYHETNFSMAYSSHISWSSPTSPVPMEVYPSLAFDSLFENRGSQRNLSVLDRVMAQVASLSRRVSATDKGKLDEYLTSVRDVEKRAQDMRAAKDKAEANATGRGTDRGHDGAAGQRAARGHPRSHAADVRHPGARLPDGQDPHRDAAAVPRHLRSLLSVPRRQAGASPGEPRRHRRRLHAHQSVLRQSVQVPD
jgi:hypothetical protein